MPPDDLLLGESELAQVAGAFAQHRAQVLFDRHGRAVRANARFYEHTGLGESDLAELDHAHFADEAGFSVEAGALWDFVLEGATYAGEMLRLLKGRHVWIDALYVPLRDASGVVTHVLCSFVDVTERRMRAMNDQAKLEALERTHAVIEFALDGTVRSANDVFLETMGYALHEVVGRHHRMFVEPDHAATAEYAVFWRGLARGEIESGVFRRLTKDGREVLLEASYSPIYSPDGEIVGITKFARDVTKQYRIVAQLAALANEARAA